ncbi:uncharacterized protein BDR25DRAFT_307069 [Lindgomyces ingoldianus]|uniref:Uncharacterized protein n=1 Tax=Lindgomyces ingoldianus TaxID=673940 RepID=A0ACB6QCX4_9PLEO|nr:uncharacterized protein BDR25DRAFT_307069 [Lindgomyces ingoldianus]KAF2464747.1 hypothetical protein BDR25DRAFT_307069 [Lindgomyces ingoldianus]
MNPPSQPRPNRARTHVRVASGDERRRVAVPRRSTKGPLEADIDDPLADHTHIDIPRTASQRVLSPSLSDATSAASPLSPQDGSGTLQDMPPKEFSFLQDPSAYHVLPATTIPPPFLNPPTLPSINTPIPSLLESGHYRLAAIAAARALVASASPTDFDALFHLLHIRLACLCLISEHALAAQESKILGDLNSGFYRHPLTDAHLVPWDLRLLTVRLAALGYGEWRKGIMGYYELARECRENISKADSVAEKTLWKARLRDCGIRVANVLVEMGELEGAGRHLGTLATADGKTDSQEAREVLIMEALVWLRVGDVRAARRCLLAATSISSSLLDSSLQALIHIADSEYPEAVNCWQALHEQHPDDAMISQNLAVSLLYTGRISEARKLLTELTDTSPPFHSMIFNLSTIYELCTEKNRDKKVALAEKMAGRKGDGTVGWEIGNAEFKL